jgi:addiction module HigA family antidote
MAEYRAGKPFPDRAPTHPGAVLREDVLPELHMSVADIAERLGVSRQMLHGVLGERHAITPEMAARLGRLLGTDPTLWLRMQQVRDLWHVQRDKAAALANIRTLA